MPDCLKITGGLTFKHDSEKLDIFLKSIILDYFRPIFEEKWVVIQAVLVAIGG
jgi:hypothetical protein